MTNICTKVTVEKRRPIKNGQVSLYLDNYLATLSPSRDLYQKDSLSKQKKNTPCFHINDLEDISLIRQ
jgi:hypothetical protein